MSYTDLGKATGLSTSAVHQRVRRLRAAGCHPRVCRGRRPGGDRVAMNRLHLGETVRPQRPDDIPSVSPASPRSRPATASPATRTTSSRSVCPRPTSSRNCWRASGPSRACPRAPRSCCPPRTRHGRPASDPPACGAAVARRETVPMNERTARADRPAAPRRSPQPADPFATAMVVERGQVAWVGSEGAADAFAAGWTRSSTSTARSSPRRYTDAHVHTTATGLALTGLDLSGAPPCRPPSPSSVTSPRPGRTTASSSATAGTRPAGPSAGHPAGRTRRGDRWPSPLSHPDRRPFGRRHHGPAGSGAGRP